MTSVQKGTYDYTYYADSKIIGICTKEVGIA